MINKEQYIQDLEYKKEILSCNAAILLIKAGFYIENKEITDNNQANLKIY